MSGGADDERVAGHETDAGVVRVRLLELVVVTGGVRPQVVDDVHEPVERDWLAGTTEVAAGKRHRHDDRSGSLRRHRNG